MHVFLVNSLKNRWILIDYIAFLISSGYKKRELRRQEGVSLPPCPTSIKIFFRQGFTKANLIQRIVGGSLTQPGWPDGGAEPGSMG
jgi:hypothetical protein